jgi:methionine sulfoxide reductase heme-binding subunit
LAIYVYQRPLCGKGSFLRLKLYCMHMDLPGIMLWLRVTARISAVLLACSLAAPGLRRLWPSALTEWMATSRHRFTLLFALSHSFHLAGIVMLAMLEPSRFSARLVSKPALAGLTGGALVYVLIYYLAWMALQRRKNPELPDTKMQTFGFYLGWVIFTVAFTTGIRRNAWVYSPLAATMWFALVIRISARMTRPASAQSAAESNRIIV